MPLPLHHPPVEPDILHNLLITPGPPGHEVEVQSIWAREARRFADRVQGDAYGNTWAIIEGTSQKTGPRVMIEAHADEIGLSIRHISEEGFLHVAPLGGSDLEILRARRVVILGRKGPVPGVIGNTATHLRKGEANDKQAKWPDLFVDIGVSNREAALATGVCVGCVAVLDDGPATFGEGLIVGRALDNRIGGYILLKILEELRATAPHAATCIAANCVHEEIGGPGARMTSFRLSPDVALVLDVTHATDTPGIDQREHGRVLLGRGPTLTHSPANHPAVVSRLESIAQALGLQIQHESASRATGTDTDDIYPSRSGVPTALVSIPLRYMHSPVECVSMQDVSAGATLIAAFVNSLESGEYFRIETGADPAAEGF